MSKDIKIYGKLVSTAPGKILADSEQISYNETNLKSTIDELKNSNTKFTEVDTLDLDSQLESGNFFVNTAKNSPTKNTKGKLIVNKSKTGSYQEWYTDGAFASRFAYYKDSIESKVYVNGQLQVLNNNILELQAQQTYELSGFISGSIRIVGTENWSDDIQDTLEKTKLIFNNLYINSNVETAIYYPGTYKTLDIELKQNSYNYISAITEETKTELSSVGCIYSLNNINISGLGFLNIRTNYKSHVIKAEKNLKITGWPHIYINGYNGHDGLHGSDMNLITGGEFIIKNVNDGIGTGAKNGEIKIIGGKFTFNNLTQDQLDCKVLNKGFIYKNVYFDESSNIDLNKCKNIKLIDETTAESIFGSPEIIFKSSKEDINEIDKTEDILTNGISESGYYILKGAFINKKLKSLASASKITVLLNNAYIYDDDIGYSYQSGSSRIQIGTVDEIDENSVNVIYGKNYAIKSENNIEINTDGGILLLLNDETIENYTVDGSAIGIWGDAILYIQSLQGTEIHIGNDKDVTKTGNSKEIIYSNKIHARLSGKGKKGTIRFYTNQSGEIYTKELSVEPGSKDLNGSKITNDIENLTFVDFLTSAKSLNESFDSNLIEKAMAGDWMILTENPDIDASLKTFDSLESATQEILNLKLGEVISVKSADTSEYSTNYDIYIVVSDGSGKTLKEIKQGGGDFSGTIDFESTVSGYSSYDPNSKIYETNIGDTLTFTSIATSSNYPNVLGRIVATVNGETKFDEAVYPDGRKVSWNFSTTNLTPGTYQIVLYAKESTGKISKRTSFTFQVGGLNLSSTFVDGTVVEIGQALTIPIIIEAADTTSQIYLTATLDDSIIANKEAVSTKTTSFVVGSDLISVGGIKNISLKLSNSKNKESNELKFTFVAAENGKVYIITDANEYSISDGGIAKIQIRTIQLGYKNADYRTTIHIEDSTGKQYRDDMNVIYTYGLNELDLTGLRFDLIDGNIDSTDSEGNPTKINFSKYTIKLSVESPQDDSIIEEKIIIVKVLENEYNIDAYIGNNLIAYYTATGKSNTSIDRDSWAYESTSIFPYDSIEDIEAPKPFKANFVNFNWDTNGWVKDENGDTALKLNHGAYVELENCAPFYYNYIDSNTGALTISVDFKTKNILDSSAKVISCLFETEGSELNTYYLRDAFGDYIKSNNDGLVERELCYTDKTKTEIRRVNSDEVIPADQVFNYDKHVYYAIKLNDAGETVRDDSKLTLDETPYSYQFQFNNIIRFFMNYGGYCWVNGETYSGNGETIYETTMIVTERNINYNTGGDNPNYNGNIQNLEDGITRDYRKQTGTVLSSVTKQTGFYIDTENAVVTTSASPANVNDKFHLNFSENTRTHIDLIINRSPVAPYQFSSIIGYTNGVLTLMKILDFQNDKFITGLKSRSKCNIYLGAKVSYNDHNEVIISDTGDADIYNLRIYNEALTPERILQNYASEISDLNEKKNFIMNNGIGNNSIPQTLPIITLIGANIGSESNPHWTINDFIMQLSGTNVADLKSIKEPAYVQYFDPTNNDKSWVVSGVDSNGKEYSINTIPIRLQFQGTSSMVYPCKNYKMKLYNPIEEKNGVVGFSINNGSVKYGKKWKVNIGNDIPDSTICLKADFMNSNHCNNTGVANFIAEYNSQISGTTPASEINSKIRTTIYGYPCLLYYKEKPSDTESKFLGVYNCNLDKSDTDCFGLDKEVVGDSNHGSATYNFGQSQFIDDDFSDDILMTAEKYNQKNGTSIPTTINLKDIENEIIVYKDYTALVAPENGTIVAALSEKGYLRSINNNTIHAVYCSEVKANSGRSGAGGFGNYGINSVASDMEIRYPDQGDLEDEEYADYTAIAKNNAISFKDFRRPYYYHFQRMIKWLKDIYEDGEKNGFGLNSSPRNRFLKEIDKHFNRKYLMDYYLTFTLLGGVDSLGKNLMIGSWGPENHLFEAWAEVVDGTVKCYCQDKSGNKVDDKYAFEYDGQWITPTKVYLTDQTTSANKYNFAKDKTTGKLLYYKEESYDRYEGVYTNGKNKFTADDVTTIPGEWIWYPTFYDIDTIGGLDNAGQLIYDVDIELDEVMDDGTTVFNTSDSILWQSVKRFFGANIDNNGNSLLSERWSTFTNLGLYDMLVGKHFYQNEVAKIPAKYYNDDCFLKYIWEGPNEQKGSGAYLYCIHGNGYEQIKRWFSQRIIYLDSYFAKIGTENASLRSSFAYYDPNFLDEDDYYLTYASDGTYKDHYTELVKKYPQYYTLKGDNLINKSTNIMIKPIIFEVKTYQPGYVGVRWFNGGKIHFIRVGRGKTAYLVGNIKTNSNQEIFIFGGSNIKEIGDLSNYNIQELNIANLSKLSKLILGNSNYTSVVNKIDGVSNNFLSEINIENCANINNLNLEACDNLKLLNMRGSGVTSVSLPSGGSLEQIYYPASITDITLKDLTNLTLVQTDTLYNLTKLNVENCPKIQGAPGKENYNGKLWELLQGTEPSPLSTINVEAYGSINVGSADFFFPNKYYNYQTAKNIKGEIEYLGSTIPKNYTRFNEAYPNLKISYPNITDASEMFANYKNLNSINSISAFAGRDIYGNSKYITIYYWVNRTTAESQDKWYSQETLNKYTSTTSSTYTDELDYYRDAAGTYYRLLKLHDDEDLDILRAEIKSHISNFTRFTNINGMFKNMAILDYLDPDTFNNVDISDATTDEMFYGCSNLKYFETPTDIVKNEILTVYLDSEGTEIEDISGMDVSQLTIKQYYVNPFDSKTRLEFIDANKTSIYPKGMRNIGKQMFYQCKQAKIYIKKLIVSKSVDDKIKINSTAFEYISYNPTLSNQAQKITLERPVILFEHTEKDILETTTEPQTTIGEIIFNNPKVEGEENLYYALDNSGLRKINYSNNYIYFSSNRWLREVYFDIKNVEIRKEFTQTNPKSIVELFYAENSSGKKILFKLYPNSNLRVFNKFNEFNIISESVGAYPLNNTDFPLLSTITIVIPKYDCLDTVLSPFDIEETVYPLFATDDNKSFFTLNEAKISAGAAFTRLNIADSESIPSEYFRGFINLRSFYYDTSLKKINKRAFYECVNLTTIGMTTNRGDYDGTNIFIEQNSQIELIDDYVFTNCENLRSFSITPSVNTLGEYVFAGCRLLGNVTYPTTLTKFTRGCFKDCINLNDFNSADLTNIEAIDSEAFYNCKNLNAFIDSANKTIFHTLLKLHTISDYAFYNCEKFTNKNIIFEVPIGLKVIGSNAFSVERTEYPDKWLVFKWNNESNEPYKNLTIGTRAFANYFIQINQTSVNEYQPSLYIPKVASIGDGAFNLYTNEKPYKYCLMENSESEIGSKWVNYTNKIVYNYIDMADEDKNGIITTYLLASSTNEKYSAYDGVAYLHHALGTAISYTFNEYCEYNGKKYAIIQVLQNAFSQMNTTIENFVFAYGCKLELIESGVIKALSSITTAVAQNSNGDDLFMPNIIPDSLTIASGNTIAGTSWYNSIKESMRTPSGSFITLGKYIIGYKALPTESSGDEPNCELNLQNNARKYNLIETNKDTMKDEIKATYTYQNGKFIDENGNELSLVEGKDYIFNNNTCRYSATDGKFYLYNADIPETIKIEFPVDNYLANCNTIFDNAFSASSFNNATNITKIKFPEMKEYNIYMSAFEGQKYLTELSLPKNIKIIGRRAFYGCPIEKIFIPKTVTEIGTNAFKYNDTSFGSLKFVDIEDGMSIKTAPFSVNTNEIITNYGQEPERVNVTFNALHIPTSMDGIFNFYYDLKYCSQMKDIYLGKLEINDNQNDENYGTIYCNNYPLYFDSIGGATFDVSKAKLDESGNPIQYYTDSIKKTPLYVPKFYHDICLKYNAYTTDYSLTTTEKYGIVPLGDHEEVNDDGEAVLVKGFAKPLDLRFIRRFNQASVYNSDDTVKFNEMKATSYSGFTAEQILRILAGYTTSGNEIFEIVLPADAATLSSTQEYLFTSIIPARYKIVRLIETNI